jgi:hypothetical protein
MSTIGNGGKAVGGIVDALKSSPLLLAIIITNLSLLGFVFYNERQHAARAEKVSNIVQSMFERCITESKK